MYTCIKNARVILPDRMLEKHSILIEDDRIINVFPDDNVALPSDCKIIDVEGKYVGPGFVDIHCHGDKDNWFYDDPVAVSRSHLAHGTTSIMATARLLPTHEEVLDSVIAIADGVEEDPDTTVIGIHMEGPYMNPKYGAYRDRSRIPKREEYYEYLKAGKGLIKTWTIAPELENINQMVADIQAATKGKTIFQVGHSEASREHISTLFPSGLKIGTHLTNASGRFVDPPKFLGTREIGVDESVWLDDGVYAEVIVDYHGSHVRYDMLKLIIKIKGVDKTIIITDSTVAEYAAPPVYEGINDVNYTDDGELMGSALTMDKAVTNV
ncbi:MAG TPA: amidohydrolase family protein [Clostridiaceae bacterium]|nr:amidohydrolase family protein [Clostridiaceae bacterium]